MNCSFEDNDCNYKRYSGYDLALLKPLYDREQGQLVYRRYAWYGV